jgi:hypothetical protein
MQWLIVSILKLLDLLNLCQFVDVKCHVANFNKGNKPFYFITVTNQSPVRDVELTHVWFASMPQVHVINPERPLPKRLRPDESWATWIEVETLPDGLRDRAFTLARVRLSTGRTVNSRLNKRVPPVGEIPGGERSS